MIHLKGAGELAGEISAGKFERVIGGEAGAGQVSEGMDFIKRIENGFMCRSVDAQREGEDVGEAWGGLAEGTVGFRGCVERTGRYGDVERGNN